MKSKVLALLIVLLGVVLLSKQIDSSSCDLFPDSYAAEIEVTGGNWTGTVHEAYDNTNGHDRLRTLFLTHDAYMLAILDFNKDEAYFVNKDGHCDSFRPSDNEDLVHYYINQETGHLYTTERLLNFDEEVVLEPKGTGQIRGIDTNTCEAHLNKSEGSFSAEWDAEFHWSVDGWRFASEEPKVPVAVILDGTYERDGQAHHSQIQYHFTDFISGELPEWLFHKPPQCPHVSQMSLPELEDNFRLTAEYKLPDMNATAMIKEVYDHSNNRIAVQTWFKGHEIVSQIDFDKKEAYIWGHDSPEECQAVKLEDLSQFMFVGSDGHLVHASRLFFYGEGNYTYWGETHVRGIPADEWRTVQEIDGMPGSSVEVHLFFSKDGWDTTGHGDYRVPLRAILHNSTDPTRHWIDIDFIEYIQQDIHPHVFHKPPFCPAADQDAVPLPQLPDDFSASIDAVIVNKKYTVSLQEFYDSTNNRLRFDTHHHNHSFVELFLLDEGKRYEVVDGVNCTEFEIDRDDPRLSNGNLYRGRDLFRFAAMNETYFGQEIVRGVPADHWHSKYDGDFRGTHIEYDADFFFSQSEWHFAHQQKQIPLRIHLRGHSQNQTNQHHFDHFYEFTNYIAGTPDAQYFAVPDVCRKHGLLSDDPVMQGAEVAGIAIGVALISVGVGFLLGALIVYLFAVKRLGRKKSTVFREMESMGEPEETPPQ